MASWPVWEHNVLLEKDPAQPAMDSPKIKLTTWLSKGTYPRLFFPIVLLILLAVLVRYHFLIASEKEEARGRWVTEVDRMAHFLLPEVLRAPDDTPAIQKKLDEELRFTPGLARMVWQLDGSKVTAQSAAPAPHGVPGWFAQLAHTDAFEKQVRVPLADGRVGVFTVSVWPDASLGDIWAVVSKQLGVSALNIVVILVALTLLLRANARMLGRLSAATRAFQSGYLDTRMQVKGTLEMQTVATTFNAMADQIEQLITSLQTAESEQADQLHFTRQLVDAFPLPVFVRSTRDVCLVVNPAWETMFGMRADSVVGKPMPSNFASLDNEPIDITAADESANLKGALEEVHEILVRGEIRSMLYFRAPFFNRNNVQLGTIAALVDITDRERDDPLSQWAESRNFLPSMH